MVAVDTRGGTVEKFSSGTTQRLQDGAAWVVVLQGDHDLSTAPSLIEELDEAFNAGAPVVVDLANVEFLDSAILNALLAARERTLARQEGSFVLVAPPGSFASRVTALVVGTLVPTYPNRAAAVASVSPSAT
jgi:anti-sigma B factor antagonist